MENLLHTLLSAGYAVQFEGTKVGDYFVLLRDLDTQRVVHCCIGNTPAEALQGAAEWADQSGAAADAITKNAR